MVHRAAAALSWSSSLIVLQQVTELQHHLFGCLIMIMAPLQPTRTRRCLRTSSIFLFGFISRPRVFNPTSSRLRKTDGCFLHRSRVSVFHHIFIHITASLMAIHVGFYSIVRTGFIHLNELMLKLILTQVLCYTDHLD